jgi:hypothetical protein
MSRSVKDGLLSVLVEYYNTTKQLIESINQAGSKKTIELMKVLIEQDKELQKYVKERKFSIKDYNFQ